MQYNYILVFLLTHGGCFVHITKVMWMKDYFNIISNWEDRSHSFSLYSDYCCLSGPGPGVCNMWLKRFGMGPQILKMCYSCTIENILTGCITVWYGNCSASDHKALQRVVCTAQYITGAKLPAIQVYTRWCQRKALKIVKDSRHPSHRLFSLLPHGKRCRSTTSRSKRLLNSFYPQAIRLLNS